MTKEEKIQESYGKYWYAVKDYVNENGWCNIRRGVNFDKIILEIPWQTRTGNQYNWRPKSLQGIENNKGWIKIESEDDLPKEKEFFRFIPCNKFDEEFTGWIDKELGEVLFIDFKYYDCKKDGKKFITESNAWLTCQITHYQQIQKPQPPIY